LGITLCPQGGAQQFLTNANLAATHRCLLDALQHGGNNAPDNANVCHVGLRLCIPPPSKTKKLNCGISPQHLDSSSTFRRTLKDSSFKPCRIDEVSRHSRDTITPSSSGRTMPLSPARDLLGSAWMAYNIWYICHRCYIYHLWYI
jgi:hypothetical protein